MRKLLFIIIMLFAVKLSYSDQLAWITKEQAEKTVAYFEDKGITQVVLWCACCDNDKKVKVTVSKIYYRNTSDPGYFEVVIEGTFTTLGKLWSEPVDLAYVHIKRGSKWRCLGKELGFECDPCTKAFKF